MQIDCWCWVELLVLYSSDAWSHLFVCRQVGSGSFGILSTKYSYVNLRFNMCINKVWHWVACRGSCAIKPTNQTKLENILSLQKKQPSPFHWNLTKSTFSPISGQIEFKKKNYHKNACLKNHIEDKTNLTFLGIKWPTEVDMVLNKTQTPVRDIEHF